MTDQDRTFKNPIEDIRREALAHYEEASSKVHHWSSFVQRAIETYNPEATKECYSLEDIEYAYMEGALDMLMASDDATANQLWENNKEALINSLKEKK